MRSNPPRTSPAAAAPPLPDMIQQQQSKSSPPPSSVDRYLSSVENLFRVDRFVVEDWSGEWTYVEDLTHRVLNDARKAGTSSGRSHGSNENSGGFQNDSFQFADGNEDPSIAFCSIFEQLFDGSMSQLRSLLGQVNSETERLISVTESATRDHRDRLQNLTEELDDISDRFKFLEDCINKVGNTTVQIGTTLENVDRQLKRATEAKRLMQYFKEFNSYRPEYFQNVVLPERKFRSAIFRNPRNTHTAARVMQQLNAIAKDLVKVQECENGITNIKRYSDHMMHTLLDSFSRSVALLNRDREMAIVRMGSLAQILADFNGADRCVQLYLDRRFDVFLNVDIASLMEQEDVDLDLEFDAGAEGDGDDDNVFDDSDAEYDDDVDSGDNSDIDLSDDDSNNDNIRTYSSGITTSEDTETAATSVIQEPIVPVLSARATALHAVKQRRMELEENLRNASKEARMQLVEKIVTVEDAYQLLLSVESCCITEYRIIEQVFAQSKRDVVHQWISKFVYDIIKTVTDRMLSIGNHRLSSAFDHLAYLQMLQTMYTQCMEFVGRIVDSPDLPFGESNLITIVEAIFEEYRRNYNSIECKYISLLYVDKMRELSEEKEAEASAMRQKRAQEQQHKGLLSNMFNTGISAIQESVGRDISHLRLDVIVAMIHENTSSMERCKQLSLSQELPDNAVRIFEILVEQISSYINQGLDATLASFDTGNARVPPKPHLYRTIQLINSILQNVQRHMEKTVLPVVSTALPVQLRCVQLKDDLFSRLENKVVRGLESMLRLLLDHTRHILETEQKKSDYRPREYNHVLDNSPTAACASCCKFLDEQIRHVSTCLYGRNRDMFFRELGMGFHHNLTMLLKQYTVTESGGIRLMRDLSDYQRCMRRLNVAEVDELFDLLREVANLFLVAPQNLPNVLSELMQKKSMSRDEVNSYIKMRADYRNNKLNKLFTIPTL